MEHLFKALRCGEDLGMSFEPQNLGSTSYTVTNKGIQMRAAFVGGGFFRQVGRAIALNCRFGDYPILLPVERMYSDRDSAAEHALLFKVRRPREVDLTTLHGSLPEPYNVALSKTGNKSEMVVAAERYLDSWLAAGCVHHTGEPFVYQTIYLGSAIYPGSGYVGNFGKPRGLGTAWAG